MYAVDKGRVHIVKILLEHGAKVNIRDTNGRTALTYASGKGYDTITKDLLDAKADTNNLDNYGKTPLSYAVENDFQEIVKLLKASGAKLPEGLKDNN